MVPLIDVKLLGCHNVNLGVYWSVWMHSGRRLGYLLCIRHSKLPSVKRFCGSHCDLNLDGKRIHHWTLRHGLVDVMGTWTLGRIRS